MVRVFFFTKQKKIITELVLMRGTEQKTLLAYVMKSVGNEYRQDVCLAW